MGLFPLADTMRSTPHPSIPGTSRRVSWRRVRNVGWWRPDPPDIRPSDEPLTSPSHLSHIHSRSYSSSTNSSWGAPGGIRKTTIARTKERRVVATVERGPPPQYTGTGTQLSLIAVEQ